MAEKRTGMQLPAGIMSPTTPHDDPADDAGQGGAEAARPEEPAPEARTPRVRKRKGASTADAKLEGRRLYLSEDVHFRLRMLAYQRGRKLSEVAQEILDRGLPKYDVTRAG